MSRLVGNWDDFGMDTMSFGGSLEARLGAVRDAGFSQVMISARDIAGHPGGVPAALAAIKASGLRLTGLQTLCDYEGLEQSLHHYKMDIAKAMIELCAAVGAQVLVVTSSTLPESITDRDAIASDLRKLAILAIPARVRIAYQALSWGKCVTEFTDAWDVVCRADAPNLGIAIDSFHMIAKATELDELDLIYPDKIFVVRLADFMWAELGARQEQIDAARRLSVFPGEGVHSAQVSALVQRLDDIGYRGDFSFHVVNDDYRQLPHGFVADRARRAAEWLGETVLRRSVPAFEGMPRRTGPI